MGLEPEQHEQARGREGENEGKKEKGMDGSSRGDMPSRSWQRTAGRMQERAAPCGGGGARLQVSDHSNVRPPREIRADWHLGAGTRGRVGAPPKTVRPSVRELAADLDGKTAVVASIPTERHTIPAIG
jgi:hypothetical protein